MVDTPTEELWARFAMRYSASSVGQVLAQEARRVRGAPLPLSSYDYSALTVDPAGLDLPAVPSRPLPAIVEPALMPLVDAPVDEECVPVAGPGVTDLAAYFAVGWPGAVPASWARRTVVERLSAAAASLPDGFGVAVFDAWRPMALQREIYQSAYGDAGLPEGFVSVPSDDPLCPPPHVTGGSVDVTLTWRGQALALGTDYDAFTALAATSAFEGTAGVVRDLRRLLFWAMAEQGFVVLDCENWHFELGTRRWAALKGERAWYGPTEAV